MKILLEDFEFAKYDRIWPYASPPLHKPEFQIDLFARAARGGYTLIGEVKNRKAKFTVKEAVRFMENAAELKKLERIGKATPCVFSFGGFFKNTIDFLMKNGIAWSEDERWLKNRPRKIT